MRNRFFISIFAALMGMGLLGGQVDAAECTTLIGCGPVHDAGHAAGGRHATGCFCPAWGMQAFGHGCTWSKSKQPPRQALLESGNGFFRAFSSASDVSSTPRIPELDIPGSGHRSRPARPTSFRPLYLQNLTLLC